MILAGLFAVPFTVVIYVLVCGQTNLPAPVTTRSSSVSLIRKNMPNLGALDITAVNYTITRENVACGVPSPSDTRLELHGIVDVSTSEAEKLQNSLEWKSAPRNNIPPAMWTMLPSGDYTVSTRVNDSFSNNPTYAHGFVVIVAGKWDRLYVLATDRDHPIR